MPQLRRGGKHVFGWAVVHPDGRVRIPSEAIDEYGLSGSGTLVLMSGSRTSGGIRAALPSALEGSVFGSGASDAAAAGVGAVIRRKNTVFCQATLDGSVLSVPGDMLAACGVAAGDKLLVIRGSDRGVTMVVRGPLVEEALGHPELEVFD